MLNVVRKVCVRACLQEKWLLGFAILVLGATASAGTVTYQYDDAGRLQRVVHPDSSTRDYTLDAAGNRKSVSSIVPTSGVLSFQQPSYAVTEGTATIQVTVVRTGTGSGAVSATYATVDSTAISGSDFTSANGTLTWADGDVTPRYITIAILNDSAPEEDERFRVLLSSPTGGAAIGVVNRAEIVVTDNDVPTFSISNQSSGESAGTMSFQVTLSPTSAVTQQVSFATSNTTAAAGSDYSSTSGALVFSANQSSRSISVPVLADSLYEGNETFTVTLSGASVGSRIGVSTAAGTIVDDDAAPSFAINDITANENAGSVTFTVTKTGSTAYTHAVNYATSNGTATANGDYVTASGTLSFAPTDVQKTVVVTLTDDSVYEGNETFTVALSAPTANATISRATGTATINENEAIPVPGAPQWSGSTAACTGSTWCSYTSAISLTWNSVQYASRYEAEFSGDQGAYTQLYNGAATSFTYSGTWGYIVNTRARACNSSGCGPYSVITNYYLDTPPPSFSVNDVSVNENAGTATFTVSKYGTGSMTHTVNYATANGTASAGADYTATSGTLSFAVAELSKTITVPLLDDGSYEGNENFVLNLSGASGGATISDSQGVGTIVENDPQPVPQPPTWTGWAAGCTGANWCEYNGSFTLSWNASAGATRYEVEFSGDNGPYTQMYNGSATSFAYTGSWGYIVYARARACSSAGCSGYSTLVNLYLNW